MVSSSNGSGKIVLLSTQKTGPDAGSLATGTVATARLGTGTIHTTIYLRGDGTSGPAGDSCLLLSSAIPSTNSGGNGTYRLTTAGVSMTETNYACLLNGSCATIKPTATAEGALSSGYTLSLRKGTFSGGALSFSDIAGSAITVNRATLQSVTVPNVNLVSGNLLGVKFVGTAAVTSQAKTIYVSCSCLN